MPGRVTVQRTRERRRSHEGVQIRCGTRRTLLEIPGSPGLDLRRNRCSSVRDHSQLYRVPCAPKRDAVTAWAVTAWDRRGDAGSLPVVTVVATDTTLALAGAVFVLGVVVLVLLVWAPWKSVRNEPPLPDDVETRLLLGEDPDQIAADEDAAERRALRASVIDLSPDSFDDDRDDF